MSSNSIALLPLALTIVIAILSQGYSKQNHVSGHHDLTYVVEEECNIGATIGNLAVDAGLHTQYPAEVVRQLRFKFLTPGPGFIHVNETTGLLYVTARIDRDAICRQQVETCRVQEDIAVQPVQYFSIVKVSKACGSQTHSDIIKNTSTYNSVNSGS